MNFGWGLTAKDLDQPPERYERPDALEQEEPPLLLVPGEHGEDGRADEVEDEDDLRTRPNLRA